MDTSQRLLLIGVMLACVIVVSAIAKSVISRRHRIDRIGRADLEAGADVVVFTSPYCHGCRQWLSALDEVGVSAQAIDIGERPDAAARYRISATPRVLVVDGDGRTVREFHHYMPREQDLDAVARLLRA